MGLEEVEGVYLRQAPCRLSGVLRSLTVYLSSPDDDGNIVKMSDSCWKDTLRTVDAPAADNPSLSAPLVTDTGVFAGLGGSAGFTDTAGVPDWPSTSSGLAKPLSSAAVTSRDSEWSSDWTGVGSDCLSLATSLATAFSPPSPAFPDPVSAMLGREKLYSRRLGMIPSRISYPAQQIF